MPVFLAIRAEERAKIRAEFEGRRRDTGATARRSAGKGARSPSERTSERPLPQPSILRGLRGLCLPSRGLELFYYGG